MTTLSLTIGVHGGRLLPTPEQKQKLNDFFFGKEKINVQFSTEKKPRSNNQNRYYWGSIIQPISDHTGYDPQETHEILKMMFLKKEVLVGRTKLDIGTSTTELSTIQMEEYLSRCRMWASQELACYLPLPNEQEYS